MVALGSLAAHESISHSLQPRSDLIDDLTTNADPAAAAALLRDAWRPLIAGLAQLSTEAQRAAVGLADRIGAVVDGTTSAADAAAVIALQTVGAVGATYGEVAERADLIVYWRSPAEPLPGMGRINPDAPREIVEVGGSRLPLATGADYEAIATLRAILAEIELDPASVEQATGVALSDWRALADRLIAADYVAIVRGPAVAANGHHTIAALTRLAQELHATTRAAIVTPPASANAAGAENVLAWQTGFPMAVDLGAGYPRYGPDEYTVAKLLERGEVDVVVAVESDDNATRLVVRRLADGEEHAIAIAPLIEGGGTYYRADGLALPLPARVAKGLPTAESLFARLLDELTPAS